MRRSIAAAALAATLLSLPAAGRAEIRFKLPPPEVATLVPLAALPLDKPPVPMPVPAVPALPQATPDLPLARSVGDPKSRPVAPLPPPRMLACNPVGTLFGVASELVECGRARFQRNELEAARAAFQAAERETNDRDIQREARYWLGETLLRLGNRASDVERALVPVVQEDPRGDLGLFATHTLGWLALDQNDPARALPRFDALLKGRIPVVLIPTARHGRALALYGLKRFGEARDEWQALTASNPPQPLAGELPFWLGDALGRLGDYKGAVTRLKQYVAAGQGQPLSEPALLSLGWWSQDAGDPAEAVRAYRALLASYPQGNGAPWARAGLAEALLDQSNFVAAREEVRRIEAANKTSPLVLPSLLALRRWAADKGKAEEGQALDSELLARTLDPSTRAWVLLVSAEQARQAGNAGEARDRLELVRTGAQTPPAVKQQADLRLAQIDFDAREYGQAQAAAQAMLNQPLPDDLRAAALVLAGESAYWARKYDDAANAYSRFLADFPKRPETPTVGFALGWAEFRRGRLDAARDRWATFARESPSDPRAAEALVLAAELAVKAGDRAEARALLDRVIGQYPGTEQAEIARVNRGIISLASGRSTEALAELNRLSGGAVSPYAAARARVAKGLALVASKQTTMAETELKSALGQGDDAIGHLGLGTIAFDRGQWDAAAKDFAEARDAGAGAVAAAAEYGIAAAAFNAGKTEDFKKQATELLNGPADPAATPLLLRGLEAVAVEEKRWPDARAIAQRLATEFPRADVTPAALGDVGAAAAANAEWPIAREMYQTLAARYPTSPAREAGRVALAEALLRTGRPAEARRELESFTMSASPTDPRRPAAVALLAEAQEQTGDKSAAAQTYAKYAIENPTGKEAPSALLGAGRLFQGEGKWSDAQPLLSRAVRDGDTAIAAEASYHLGEGLRATGQNDQAAEAYMTAAYVAPDTIWGRRGLLGAGRAFAAANQKDAAIIVYRKLAALPTAEPDLVAAARTGLTSLGVR